MNAEQVLVYETARDELNQRVALRDQALMAYVVAIGAFFAFALQSASPATEARMLVALGLPVLSLAFTLIVLQHEINIGLIRAFMQACVADAAWHWSFYPRVRGGKSFRLYRTLAQALALCTPSLYDLGMAVSAIRSGKSSFGHWDWPILVYSVAMTAIVVALHVRVHTNRTDIKASVPRIVKKLNMEAEDE
jgi:hypothetical protein